MLPRITLVLACIGVLSLWNLLRAQQPFREWPAIEYENFKLPPDYQTDGEWVRARLRYHDIVGYPNDTRARLPDRRAFPGYCTMDYRRTEPHLLAGMRVLTRIKPPSA